MKTIKKYHLHGAVSASSYLGEFEADSDERAIEMATDLWDCSDASVCHQCSQSISDPEISSIELSDEHGNIIHEETNDYYKEKVEKLETLVEKMGDLISGSRAKSNKPFEAWNKQKAEIVELLGKEL